MTEKTKVPIRVAGKGDEEIPAQADDPVPEEEVDSTDADETPAEAEVGSDKDALIADLEEQLRLKHEQLLRAAADLDNLRKRMQRDLGDAATKGRADVLSEILPTLDNLDLAIDSAQSDGVNDGILQGIVMVKRQLLLTTERFGLKQLESMGKAFDPAFHEAVAQVFSEDEEPGRVINEMRSGYMLGDRLLRPAMVVVSRGKPEPSDQEPSDDAPEGEAEADSEGEIRTGEDKAAVDEGLTGDDDNG